MSARTVSAPRSSSSYVNALEKARDDFVTVDPSRRSWNKALFIYAASKIHSEIRSRQNEKLPIWNNFLVEIHELDILLVELKKNLSTAYSSYVVDQISKESKRTWELFSDSDLFPSIGTYLQPEAISVVTQDRTKDRNTNKKVLTRFTPTRELVEHLERGLRALIDVSDLERFGLPNVDIDPSLANDELAEVITIRIERMLATLGGREMYSGTKEIAISEHGRFSLRLQFEILDRLPIRPDETTDFFSMLYSEIVAFLKAGGRLGGAWGEVVEHDNELYLRTLSASILTDENWEPVASVEGDMFSEN